MGKLLDAFQKNNPQPAAAPGSAPALPVLAPPVVPVSPSNKGSGGSLLKAYETKKQQTVTNTENQGTQFKGQEISQATPENTPNELQQTIYEKTGSGFLANNFVAKSIGDAVDTISGAANEAADKLIQTVKDFSAPKGTVNGVTKGTDIGQAALGLANVPLSAIGGVFKGAESLPIVGKPVKVFNNLFGLASRVPGSVIGSALSYIPADDQESKDKVIKLATDAADLATSVFVGDKVHEATAKYVAPIVSEKISQAKNIITKDLVAKAGLPENVFVNAKDLHEAFGGGEAVTPEEATIAGRAFGMSAKEYKAAIKNDSSVQVPSAEVITYADKPWWGKVKSLFGKEPTTENVIKVKGKPLTRTQAGVYNYGLSTGEVKLPEANTTAEVTSLSDTGGSQSEQMPASVIENAEPERIVDMPIDTAVDARIKRIMQIPEQTLGFAKKILESVQDDSGINLGLGADISKPKMVDVKEGLNEHSRPAEYDVSTGRINFYPTEFLRDLFNLAEGKTVLAHGEDLHPQVYKLNPGESISDLATRYFKDIMIHELAHAKTTTGEHKAQLQDILDRIVAHTKAGDGKKVLKAQMEFDKLAKNLESSANKHARDNYTALHDELFPEAKPRATVKLDRSGRQVLGVEDENKITKTEKSLLKKQIQDKAQAFGEGRKSGKKETNIVRDAQEENRQMTREQGTSKKAGPERQAELDKLKQRILDRARRDVKLADQREVFNRIMERIKNRKVTEKEVKDELMKTLDLLPKDIRGDFINRIVNAKTETDFFKVTEAIRKAADENNIELIHNEISKELKNTKTKYKNGFPTNVKVTPEAEASLKEIKNNLHGDRKQYLSEAKDLGLEGGARNKYILDKEEAAYEKAQKEITDIQLKYAGDPEGIPDAEIAKIEKLKMIGTNFMSQAQLRDVLSSIQEIKENGRTKIELDRFNQDTIDQRNIEAATQVVTPEGKTPKVQEISYPELNEKKSVSRAAYEMARDFIDVKSRGIEEHLRALSKYDQSSSAYGSFLNRTYGRAFREAGRRNFEGMQKSTQGLIDTASKIYDIDAKDHGAFEKLKSELDAPVEMKDVPFKDGITKDITASRGLAMDVYMKSLDHTLDDTFEKNGWTDATKKAYESILTPEDKQMAQGLLDIYRERYTAINETYRKLTGTNLPFNEFYSPLSRIVDGKPEETQSGLEFLAKQNNRDFGTGNVMKSNKNLQVRVENALPIKFNNPFSDMEQNIARMEFFKAYADPLRSFSKLVRDKGFRTAVKEFHTPEDLAELERQTRYIARSGADGGKIIRAVEYLKRKTTSSLIGYNWNIMKQHAVGVLNWLLSDMKASDLTKGTAKFIAAPKETIKFFQEHSPLYRERYAQFNNIDLGERILDTLKHEPSDVKKNPTISALKTANETFNRTGYLPLRSTDIVVNTAGMKGAYDAKFKEMTEKGMSEEDARAEAINYAEEILDRTWEGGTLINKSYHQTEYGSLGRVVNLFQTLPMKTNRFIIAEMRDLKYGRGDRSAHLKNLAIAMFVIPMLRQFIVNSDSSLANKAEHALLSPVTNIPILGNLIETGIEWSEGKPWTYDPSAVTAFSEDLHKSITDLKGGDFEKFLIDFGATVGESLTGTPVRTIHREVKSIVDKVTK